jgi:hypothetical protein
VERSAIALPAVAVSRGNSFLVVRALDSLHRCSRLALVNGYYADLVLYDGAGRAWQVIGATPARRLTRLGRWLARTVYNPRVAVSVRYAEPRPYDLAELKHELTTLIDLDPDDLYDQFVTHDELKGLVSRAATRAELFRVAETLGSEDAKERDAG